MILDPQLAQELAEGKLCPTFETEYFSFEIESDLLGTSKVTYEFKVIHKESSEQ